MKIKFMLGENPTLSEIVNVLNKSKTYVITTVSEYNQKVYTNHIFYEWDEDDNDWWHKNHLFNTESLYSIAERTEKEVADKYVGLDNAVIEINEYNDYDSFKADGWWWA